MIETTPQTGRPTPEAILRQRCTRLGLASWRFDAEGSVASRPEETGPAGQWLRSRAIERRAVSAVRRWAEEAEPSIIEAFPGCWLLPAVESQRRRRRGYLVAMALGPEALDSEQFHAACQSARLDAAGTRSALRPRATFDRATAERAGLMLSWLRDDLETMAADQSALAGFGRQLTESYEEISLLYTLGQSMNQLVQPQKFVRLACDELQATLAFRWIAVRFVPNRRTARGMAGRLFVSGNPPCAGAELEGEAGRLLEALEPEQKTVIPASDAGPLGRGESELLVHPIVRDGQVVGALLAGDKEGEDRRVSSVDMKLLDAAAGYLSILLDNAFLYDDQQLMFVGTLEALTASIDAKDPYTRGHSERVAHLAAALASVHGLDEEQCERIRIAGLVHDVGKIGVPEGVLCKAGRLTTGEFDLIKQHPEIGFQILKDIPQMDDLLPGVLHHHERFDGRGYPHGLSGAEIPLIARIIGLADSFDAMSSNRTYRPAMARANVLKEISDNAGTQFDPDLVGSFLRVGLAHYDQLVARHHNEGDQGSLRIRRRGAAA